MPLALIFGIWAGCQGGQPSLSETEKAEYTLQGQNIAQGIATLLTSTLTNYIASSGIPKAAQYCSYMAVPLVDTLAVKSGVHVRRTSDKLRSSKNAPTQREAEILAQFAQQKAGGKEIKPIVEAIDAETVAYYQPILVKPLCLDCHGTLGETLTEENYSFIKYLYPNDQAIGYALDDLRGIWSIEIPRKKMN